MTLSADMRGAAKSSGGQTGRGGAAEGLGLRHRSRPSGRVAFSKGTAPPAASGCRRGMSGVGRKGPEASSWCDEMF